MENNNVPPVASLEAMELWVAWQMTVRLYESGRWKPASAEDTRRLWADLFTVAYKEVKSIMK